MDNEAQNKTANGKKKRTLLQRIVNAFLYTCIGFLVLLLIFLGISQTHTFREFLREKIIEEANSSLNGKIYIEEIEGTIFTSLILRNTVVNMERDTILKAETISVLTSPLQLLLKKIYVRDFEIDNATVNLSTDSSGTLNLVKLFPATEPDTSTSEFPFKIHIANLQLSNINFSYRNFAENEVPKEYAGINYNDIEIRNLNLELAADLDISDNSYELTLFHLSFLPNIAGFNLRNLKGEFVLNEKNILVRNFEVQTDRSDFNVGIVINDFNVFDTLSTDFSKTQLTVLANSRSFSFKDLRVFLPSVSMLDGNFTFDLNVSGSPSELELNHIQVLLQNSNIEGTGSLKNLDKPGSLFISADLDKSYIEQKDIQKLFPSIEMPSYPELGIIRFDTLRYEGSPLKFKTNLGIATDKGSFGGLINLDLEKELMEYETTFLVSKLDLKPFADISSSINLSGKIKGKGTSPANFDGSINLTADGSKLNGNEIDSLRLSANAINKNISYNFYLVSHNTKAGLSGILDFTNEENPFYRIAGDIKNLDVAEFSEDSLVHTDLNFTFDGEGESFDQDKMNLFMSMKLFDSKLAEVYIDSVRAIVDLQGATVEERIINIISDIADVTMTGNFKVTEAIDLLTSEAGILSEVYNDKLQKLFPTAFRGEEIVHNEKTGVKEPLFSQVGSPMNINYAIELKDFNIISAFIGDYHLEIDAEMGGKIINDENSIHFSFNTDLNYIKLWNDESAFFVTKMGLDLDVLNDFNVFSTSDVEVDLDVSAERIFSGSDIYDFHFDMKMQEDKAEINFGAEQKPISVNVNAGIDISRDVLDVSIDSLRFSDDQFLIVNKEPLSFTYTENRIDIKTFDLVHNDAHLKANGFLSRTGNQKLNVTLSGLKGQDLSVNLFHLRPENSMDANINLNLDVSGNMVEPVINMDMSVDSVKYGGRTFGVLKSKVNYKNKNLDLDIAFVDSLLNPTSPALKITGYVPVDLSIEASSDNYIGTRPMDIRLKSDGFNLGAFGDILPAVNRLRGNFTSDLRLTGTPSSLKTEGYLKIKDAAFFLEANNLEYNASAGVRIEGNQLTIDSLMIANVEGTINGGKLTGRGVALLDNFTFISSKFSFNGDLKVLDEASKSASPSFYGSLVIGTNGTLEFDEGRIFLKAPVTIKNANLTFPQTQSAYSGSENYVYRFVEDTVTILNEEMDYERLINIYHKQGGENDNSSSKKNIFDYDLRITIEDEAIVVFVLSKEFNQNLKAVLDGSIRLEKYGNKTEAQGKLSLLEGSTLEFLKTLEAEGSIRFESEIANPYLDIVATYRDYYYPADETDAEKEVEVAVKIEIQGPLKELDKRLISEGNNIKVYYGSENIAKNNPSPQYDASDAAMFILLGKFNDDARQQDRYAIASTATGLAGSLVGGFLNRQFGDVIKSVELRQVGSATKISLIGRAGNFRYEIGTSTDVYQDLSRANIKIEYPVSRQLLLRLERKEAINTETTYTSEMINELGLKYRFEF